MGVTGLWTVVQPCARPIKVETLNRKRLAVDASIWIYQFLKAVRDKEGNALRNSHVVGFFRRICKLLFFGIKPVFVFDGGAPALKRQTISSRKHRREGRREDAARTAGKLLALQMQRRAVEEEETRKADLLRAAPEEEEPLPDELVYVDELQMTQKERKQSRKFKKTDAYHLPDLDVSLVEMGGPNDPRVMSLEELEQYARQFDTGEDINVYDFSKIDFDSAFFLSLPASDRYNILNAARLRSRLRMGLSKEQLDKMYPNRMDFSRFQIERVMERNNLTQRLMNINGMSDPNEVGRVAGEKGREYVLVRNEGVEGGWALGVVGSNEDGDRSKPIDVEGSSQVGKEEDEEEEEVEDAFEDVPIEGLNRLPKRAGMIKKDGISDDLATTRKAFYRSRQKQARSTGASAAGSAMEDPNSLFVVDRTDDNMDDWEDVNIGEDQNGMQTIDEEDEELNRAIALSLQKEAWQDRKLDDQGPDQEGDEDEYTEVFQQRRADDAKPFTKSSAKAIASMANQRSAKQVPKPFAESDSEDEPMDLQKALTESRISKRQPRFSPRSHERSGPTTSAKAAGIEGDFSGPLPFEKLDLGSSLLGKKKMKKLTEETAGGFEKDETRQRKSATPLPPWFSGDVREDVSAQKAIEEDTRRQARQAEEECFVFDHPSLRRKPTREVIDLDDTGAPSGKVIDLDSEAEDEAEEPRIFDAMTQGPEVTMGDITEMSRAGQSSQDGQTFQERVPQNAVTETKILEALSPGPRKPANLNDTNEYQIQEAHGRDEEASEEGMLEWDESDLEGKPYKEPARSEPLLQRQDPLESGVANFEDANVDVASQHAKSKKEHDSTRPAGGPLKESPSQSPSVEFETIDSTKPADGPLKESPFQLPSVEFETIDTNAGPINDFADLPGEDEESDGPSPASGTGDLETSEGEKGGEEFDSDPEDEELMQQLATEAEEHARFASSLNNKSHRQNIEDYEQELKQLRSQQKKDRRDADEVSHTMAIECQQLLKNFGIPYITAPMEAEAQCAELVSLGLVDGVVTDDSDIFLFGGTRVYKNVFNSTKYVECYLTADLEKEFGLTREKLIHIAHLLGSDYTEGLPGVGPVSALEILSEFSSLEDFKQWWTGVQMGTISKADDADNPWRKRFRRNATKLFLPPTFPDQRVDAAYLNPEVDSDSSPFQWGVPDLNALRSFLMATIGWTQERTDEVLVPVIRDMNRRDTEGTQGNITNFFSGAAGAGAFAPRVRAEGKSKRMETALNRIAAGAGKERDNKQTNAALDEGDDDLLTGTDAIIAVSGSIADGNRTKTSTGRKPQPKKRGQKRPTAANPSTPSDSNDYSEQRKKVRRKQVASQE